MPDENSAATVGLDLVIENTAAEQLKKIAKSAIEPAKQHFSAVGKGIRDSVYAQVDEIQKKIHKSVTEPYKKAAESFKEPKGFQVATDNLGLMEQKLGNIGAQMGSLTDKLTQLDKEYEKIVEKKGFDSEEAKKLEDQITSLQGKLINLQSTAISTEEKLTKAMEAPAKAAEKARQAVQKTYDSIINQAANASRQAEAWALKAERAQSRSVSRAAKHAQKAYSKQAKSAMAYANKYADAQSDSSDKAAKALEKAHKRMEKAAQKAANASLKATRKMAKDSSSGASAMGGAFQKLGKTITRSLKAVFVTAVLYKFFKAFKDNITGAMSKNKEFAKSLNEIKANLSVAFTPIIEAVMPLITRLAQGLATITKYIASFIAAIFGKTYKQAVDSTKKLQSQAEKAKASSSRDFDELHNVDKDDSDSDSSGIDYSVLDTSSLNTGPMQKFQEILEKIKGTIEKVKPSFKNLYEKGIKPVVNWFGGKVKDAFSFLGEQLGKVGDWFVKHKDSFSRLGDSLGKLWKFLEPIFNAAWSNLKILIGGAFDALLIGFGKLIDIAPDVVDLITNFFKGDWSGVKEAGKNILIGLWEGVKEQWENTKKWFSELFSGIIDYVKAIFGIHSPSTVFADIGRNLIHGLINGISAIWEKLKTFVSEKLEKFKSSVKEKFTSIKNTVLDTLSSLKDGFKTRLTSIYDSFKSFINKMLGGVEKMINKPVTALNSFIDKLNKLKVNIPEILGGGSIGFNINKFSPVSIPRLAKGGIVSKPTLSLIGEAGKEAVVPLENNTEWMEKLSAMLGNTITAVLAPFLMQMMQNGNQRQSGGTEKNLILNIDGKTFAKLIIDLLRKYPQNLDLVGG